MASQPAATDSAPQPAQKLKQMLLTDRLKKHLGDTLHADLSGDEPEYRLYIKVLLPPRSRGRPEDMSKLLTFLNESQHPDCIGRKTTCETLTLWINELREVGIKENERLIGDSESGRSSVTEVQPEYIKVWADLMQLHDDGKKEAVKITRYNRVPDHLVGKVQLITVNSALLPDPRSIGAGAGKIYQAEAIQMVLKRKQDALAKQAEEGDTSGKTREHIETKRRVGAADGGQGRDNIELAMVSLLQAKERKAGTDAARLAFEERKEMNARLDKYTESP